NNEPLDLTEKLHILYKLNAAEAFEKFVSTAYLGQKRFSLEGCETLIPVLDAFLTAAAQGGVQEVVMGMSHRGRLNVLVNIVGKSFAQVFREFEDFDPESTQGSGDVKYHLGATGTHCAPDGSQVQITLASNPSHLESVNPVVEGMVRARQELLGDDEHLRVIPLLLHGDAAFAGQGVVQETLAFSQLKGYRTGGTMHVIVNNQIGFTTLPEDARSSHYATDVAKSVGAPIFHVNADHPQAAVRVIRTALAYRQRFKRDVVVDLVCYRRWGHNEGDEPAFTQPLMYQRIRQLRSVRKLATERLLVRGEINMETAESMLEDFQKRLDSAFQEVKELKEKGAAEVRPQPCLEVTEGAARPPVETGVPAETLERVLNGILALPDDFEPHPKLRRQLDRRRSSFEENKIDWGLGETLAFGTLVLQGIPVRLSGEDSGRATFSQRHAVIYDHRNGRHYLPLQHLHPDQGEFHVYDSLLSEFGVLGFEYGYSVVRPEVLLLWEAQFGDFVNGAQVIIDQYISSAEEKWRQKSGLVMLLPHGYEGQGPEHSSARLERFLQLCSEGNLQVTYPTSPAQYFHLLRRQVIREERKPLIVMTPKSLLRLPAAASAVADFTSGSFRELIDDPEAPGADRVQRVLLASGKVYYDLLARRSQLEKNGNVALVRLEQFYPFPGEQLGGVFEKYHSAKEVVWVQEEPRNMGGWDFVDERILELLAP
ncbi:MAG: multifunctional oxoglutarate decarboxylase/oxoglutarate dehydrogenase thiamine pyrophosphate-binding subunit/dihydrolipoyllysine-residue succinyltransferase subunit, partial [Planctomycetota bacterium]